MMKRLWLCSIACSILGVEAEDFSPVDLYEIPLREEMKLIANGGTARGSGENSAFTTTRGVVWILENPRASGRHGDFRWRKFASGLRRPGRIEVSPDGGFVVWQHSEVTHLIDGDGDGTADQFLRIRDRADRGGGPGEGVPRPFEGFRSWGTKRDGQYRGQQFGGESGRPGLSRLSVEHDDRGSHYTLITFVRGIRFAIDCLVFLDEDTWLIAQSNRHDPRRSRTRFALHRLDWQSRRPFEVISIRVLADGFRLAFSDRLMKNTAQGAWAYRIEEIGVESRPFEIVGVDLSDDEKFVTLRTEKPVAGRVYRVTFDGVWSINRDPVRIPMARVALIENNG